MTDKSLHISRVGEPSLVGAPTGGQGQKVYKITTTPLPAGDRGYNWFMFFSEQLTGPLLAEHDRNEIITVTCDPDQYPDWLERVDAAIERANEKEGTIPSAQ